MGIQYININQYITTLLDTPENLPKFILKVSHSPGTYKSTVFGLCINLNVFIH